MSNMNQTADFLQALARVPATSKSNTERAYVEMVGNIIRSAAVGSPEHQELWKELEEITVAGIPAWGPATPESVGFQAAWLMNFFDRHEFNGIIKECAPAGHLLPHDARAIARELRKVER